MRRRGVTGTAGATRSKVLLARQMRAEPTEAEAVLWRALRGRRLAGWRFRRQHVLAGFVVDFYCPSLWLAIEVDGPIHDERRVEDDARTQALATLGVRVLRFRNEDILSRLQEVLEVLTTSCQRIAEQVPIARRRLRSPSPRSCLGVGLFAAAAFAAPTPRLTRDGHKPSPAGAWALV